MPIPFGKIRMDSSHSMNVAIIYTPALDILVLAIKNTKNYLFSAEQSMK